MTLKSVPSVRFENELDLDDLEDVSWAEVLGTVPMAESAGEPAILHRLDELPLVRAPRGTQPQDGVWRMRGGVWINRHGMALYEEDAGESGSADDDELGSARPAASHAFTSHPLCNHRFCVRRWLQRLQCHAFGPRPLYLTRFRFTPVTSPAPRTPAPPYASSLSEQTAVCAQMPPRAGAPRPSPRCPSSSEMALSETVADGLLDRSIMIVGNVYHFKELLKARFPQIKYLDLVFNNGDTIKAAWVLPESAQTKDTGTLAEYLTSLGVEVSEIDLDEEDDDDDDSDLDDDDLIDAEAEEAGEEEEEE